ncbi:Cof-type HAD-IIB family hydrolase [Pelosinus sp. sgz500959]|uniref:Cof-type HAD-IIB family hydrolase n=1 Tax=Pelosinus sp. sgz500959 TaxID=3242472 RepID=UPI00366D201A
MAIKLVAIDMDDTLLDNTLKVSSRTCEAIRKAQEQGVIVTIATGRMFASVVPFAQQLNIQVPVISYNGGMVRHPHSKEVLFHQSLGATIAGKIVEIFRERGWYLQSYMDDEFYVIERCEKAKGYEKLSGIQAIVVGDAFYTMKHEPTKMLSVAEPHELEEIQQVLNKELGDTVFLATSKSRFLEITHPQVNKGHALAVLAEKLMIRQDEIMAIGDSNNDYPMIEYAGFGVAMGNASARVKSIAQAVTADNNHHGVAEAIEKYVLAK